MKKSASGLLLSVAAIGLAACSTSSNDAVMQFSTQTVIDQANRFLLDTTVEATTADLVGVAEMQGYYEFAIPSDATSLSVFGAARTKVDFSSMAISGSVEDLRVLEITRDEVDDASNQVIFEAKELEKLSGTLGISGSVSGTGFLTSINGRLAGSGASEFGDVGNYTVDVNSQSAGSFWKTASGDLVMNGGSSGSFAISAEDGSVFVENIERGVLSVSE